MESYTNSKLQFFLTISTLSFYFIATAAAATTPQSDKDEFLKAHNEIRAQMGEPEFKWDPKLEEYARNYGSQRAEDCQLEHSQGPYGENLFWGSGAAWNPRDAVVEWVKEDVSYNVRGNSCQPGKVCGHYTQIIWKSSCRLGCVRIVCKTGDTYAICEYDPPGNYVGEKPLDGITH